MTAVQPWSTLFWLCGLGACCSFHCISQVLHGDVVLHSGSFFISHFSAAIVLYVLSNDKIRSCLIATLKSFPPLSQQWWVLPQRTPRSPPPPSSLTSGLISGALWRLCSSRTGRSWWSASPSWSTSTWCTRCSSSSPSKTSWLSSSTSTDSPCSSVTRPPESGCNPSAKKLL